MNRASEQQPQGRSPDPKTGALPTVTAYLDDDDVPTVKFNTLTGRRSEYPIAHPFVTACVVRHLNASDGRMPSRSDVDSFKCLMVAEAFLSGRIGAKTKADEWKDSEIDRDPFTLAIVTLANREAVNKHWEITSLDLLTKVNMLALNEKIDKGEGWPAAPHRLSIELDRRSGILRELGIEVTKLARHGTGRKWRIRVTQPGKGDGWTGDASPPNGGPNPTLGRRDASDAAFARHLETLADEPGKGVPPSPAEITGWRPKSWDDVVGNESVIEEAQSMIKAACDGRPVRDLIITGERNTGKGTAARLIVQSIMCLGPEEWPGNPCGECGVCQWGYGDEAEFTSDPAHREDGFRFIRFGYDSTKADAIPREFDKVKAHKGNLLVYLDRLDLFKPAMLKATVEQMKDSRVVWVATAEDPGAVPEELRREFDVVTTSTPERQELAEFVARRCAAWAIEVEDGFTILDLADRCGQNPGRAMKAVAKAAGADRSLSSELVKNMTF